MTTIRVCLVGFAISAFALACGSVKNPGADSGTPDAMTLECSAPQADCGGAACVDTDTDDSHCGQCDRTCDSDRECVAGDCACTAGTVECGGNCIDPLTDNLSCGAGADCSAEPGVVCDADSTCLAGVCRRSLQNGGFETGDYTGWTLSDNATGFPDVGIWALLQAGTSLADISKGMPPQLFDHQDGMTFDAGCMQATFGTFPSSIVNEGLWAGMHTQNEEGRHVLTQTIYVRATDVTLSWDMAYATDGFTATTQYLALNINTPAGLLVDTPLKIFDTVAGDPIIQPTFMTYNVDLTPYRGMEIQIELELMVQDDCFTVFFDNFRVQ